MLHGTYSDWETMMQHANFQLPMTPLQSISPKLAYQDKLAHAKVLLGTPYFSKQWRGQYRYTPSLVSFGRGDTFKEFGLFRNI